MTLSKELKQLSDKAKQYPLVCLVTVITTLLLFGLPKLQVYLYGINNDTVNTTLENPYLSVLYKIISIGFAGFIGIATLYYSRKQSSAAEKSNIIAQESQRTGLIEHYSRAIDQLGSEKMEIRLGAISSLEIIENKSDEYYWQIMELLTAYIRKNSSIVNTNIKIEDVNSDIEIKVFLDKNQNKVSLDTKTKVALDIQTALTVIGRRKYSFNAGESNIINLQRTYLQKAYLPNAHLEMACLWMTDLIRANLSGAHLEGAYLVEANLEEALLLKIHLKEADLERANLKHALLCNAHLEGANFKSANLVLANLGEANLEEADLEGANLNAVGFKMANLRKTNLKDTHLWLANLEEADLGGANFEKANLEEAYLKGAKNLTIDQLSKVKTLYNAKLDEELEITLKDKYPTLFDKPDN